MVEQSATSMIKPIGEVTRFVTPARTWIAAEDKTDGISAVDARRA
jgi:hypothetical protein